jgi:RNA polymerase sigma-70 factor (ECF subfamily)
MVPPDSDVTDPAAMDALLGEMVTLAFLAALETMTPEERLVFALHEVFGLSTDETGTVLGRSPASARRLVKRARGRIRGAAQGRHTSARPRV